jgi:hypothetical protein
VDARRVLAGQPGARARRRDLHGRIRPPHEALDDRWRLGVADLAEALQRVQHDRTGVPAYVQRLLVDAPSRIGVCGAHTVAYTNQG